MRAAVRRFAAVAAAVAAACAAPACGPQGPVRAAVPEALVADAPWERAWDPSERTAEIAGLLVQPADPPTEGHPFDPCEGARVELLLPRPDGTPPLEPVAETTTGPDGAWRLGPIPPGVFVIRASKPGYTRSLGASRLKIPGAVELAGTAVPTLGAHPATTLRARVVDRSGRPVAGVRVQALSLAWAEEARTGDDGTFSVTAPDARVVVSVLDPKWEVTRAVVDPDARADGRIVDVPTAPVRPYAGVVVATEDDRPIEGAVVVSLEDPLQRTTTDAQGRFRLPIPRAGRVAAFAAGRGWRSYEMTRAADQEFRLAPARGVSGRVVGADGKPVAAARLLALVETRDGALERVWGPLTDSEGRFDFSWLPDPPRTAREPAVVVAWHRLRGMSDAIALPAAGPVELKLSGWQVLQGRVSDHLGAPVVGAEVHAAWSCAPLGEANAGTVGVPTQRIAYTDATGAYRLPGVPADRPIDLRATLYGLELQQSVGVGDPSERPPLELPAGQDVSGRVTDGDGRGVAGAAVTAELVDVPGLKLRRAVTTEADGVFRFENLPAGRYALEASAPGFDLRGGGEARPGQSDVRLVVERSGRITLRLAFDGLRDGEERPELMVAIEDLDALHLPPRRVKVASADVAEPVPAGAVHPGRWRVQVEGGVWRGRVDLVELADGDDRVLDVRMERTLRLQAVLLDGRGTPMSGEQVLLVPAAGTAGQSVTTWSGDGGRIDVAGLRPGTWEVRIAPRFEVPLTTQVTMPAEGAVEFRLPPSGEIVVRVAGADGKPLAGAIVGLATPDGRALYGWTDDAVQLGARFRTGPDGSVRVRGVPTGRVRVEAAAGPTRFTAREADVSADRPAEVSCGP